MEKSFEKNSKKSCMDSGSHTWMNTWRNPWRKPKMNLRMNAKRNFWQNFWNIPQNNCCKHIWRRSWINWCWIKFLKNPYTIFRGDYVGFLGNISGESLEVVGWISLRCLKQNYWRTPYKNSCRNFWMNFGGIVWNYLKDFLEKYMRLTVKKYLK